MRKKINSEIAPTLKKMQVGETQMFHIKKAVNVRNTCSQLKKSLGIVFSTKQDNSKSVIEVTKIN